MTSSRPQSGACWACRSDSPGSATDDRSARQADDRSVRSPSRARLIARVLLAALLLGLGPGSFVSPRAAAAVSLPRWTGGVDLYRSGVFTTQQTWLWCTAADVQIMRNIVRHQADHSRSGQQRYFDYMRAHDRYAIPVSDGVDPAGWTAGLQHYVDGRYRLVASTSFDRAMRSAVTNLRRTNLPVAITVSHGNHAWILTGFTATADPAVTTKFTVTSVRVTGSLWGLQSRTYGYDMRPDTKLTPAQLMTFFTPWHYAGVKMAWEGRWVSVQPVAAPAAAPVATPKPAATAKPTPTPTEIPTAIAATPSVAAVVEAEGALVSPAATPPPYVVALVDATTQPPTAIPTPSGVPGAETASTAGYDVVLGVAVLGLLLVVAGSGLVPGRRRRSRPPREVDRG